MASGSSSRFIVGVSVVVFVFGLVTCGVTSAATRYAISSGGYTTGQCASWGKACTLQTALGVAASGDSIWVAAGVYKPTTTTDQTIGFAIPPGVAVYGGFAVGDTLLSQQDPAANLTVLSGDIDGNDAVDANGIDETYSAISGSNSYHVVTMDGTSTPITQTTVLDGFTITAGYANGAYPNIEGGGLDCNGAGSASQCSPTLSHLAFRGNSASNGGGAIFNNGTSVGTSSPTLTDITFSGNRVTGYSDNDGGAIWDDAAGSGVSSPTLTNVTFSGNSIAGNGKGGAIANTSVAGNGSSSPTLTNVTFSGNSVDGSSGKGGAIYDYGVFSASSPQLTNVILWGDKATDGPEIYNDDVSGNGTATPSINYSVVEGGDLGSSLDGGPDSAFSGGTNNLSINPNLGPLQNNGGSTETMALLSGSSAIDTGTNTGCPNTDQRGVARPQDGDRNGTAICDIGAYEVLGSILTIPVLSGKGLTLLGLLLAVGALALLRRT